MISLHVSDIFQKNNCSSVSLVRFSKMKRSTFANISKETLRAPGRMKHTHTKDFFNFGIKKGKIVMKCSFPYRF
eukprot:UN08324